MHSIYGVEVAMPRIFWVKKAISLCAEHQFWTKTNLAVKTHIHVVDVAQMTWVTTGHGYLEWEETCASRCDLEWEENRPIKS